MKRPLTFLCLVLALTCTSFAACGTTGGRPITVNLFAEGDGDTFTTATGWTVALTDAHVALGPVYVLAPIDAGVVAETITNGSARRARTAVSGPATRLFSTTLRELLAPSIALAHGGHEDFGGRAVRAEWLDQANVDLLALERTALGVADGSAGPAGDVTVDLEPPGAAIASASHGHHAWVAGTATMGTTTIPFEGGLDIPDEGLSRRVEGIPAAGDYDEGGEVTLTVHVSSWLDQMRFERLAEPASGETRVIAPGSQPHTAWYIGARTASAFSTTYVGPGGS